MSIYSLILNPSLNNNFSMIGRDNTEIPISDIFCFKIFHSNHIVCNGYSSKEENDIFIEYYINIPIDKFSLFKNIYKDNIVTNEELENHVQIKLKIKTGKRNEEFCFPAMLYFFPDTDCYGWNLSNEIISLNEKCRFKIRLNLEKLKDINIETSFIMKDNSILISSSLNKIFLDFLNKKKFNFLEKNRIIIEEFLIKEIAGFYNKNKERNKFYCSISGTVLKQKKDDIIICPHKNKDYFLQNELFSFPIVFNSVTKEKNNLLKNKNYSNYFEFNWNKKQKYKELMGYFYENGMITEAYIPRIIKSRYEILDI